MNFAFGNACGVRQHAHETTTQGRFSAAAFTDKPDDGPCGNIEIGAIDGTDGAGARSIVDAEIANGEENYLSPSLGNSNFSDPREIMNPASTISTMARPGGTNQFQAPRESAWLA